MLILAHRGYWLDKSEQNTSIAFERAFCANLGIETDLRDYGSKIVIAHDIPKGNELSLEDLLTIMAGKNLCLALNIKSSGIGKEILAILNKYNHDNYFTFDMALPDLLTQLKDNICAFTGMSDLQKIAPLFEQAPGVWLDSFAQDWFDTSLVDTILKQGKKLCVVSAELHNREEHNQWTFLKNSKYLNSPALMLCTDNIKKAKVFFND